MRSYVRLIKTKGIAGAQIEESAITQDWRTANARVRELELAEPRVAEIPELISLPDEIETLGNAELGHTRLQRNFGVLQYSWAMVELDRLIAWQSYVVLSYVSDLRRALPKSPKMEDLIRFSAGRTMESPPPQVMSYGGNKFVISSASSDLRVTDTALLSPLDIKGYEPHGQPCAVVGVYVGYSLNVLSAVHMHDRLLLINGTHRAYAMRASGITHAPCLIQHAASKDDLDLVAAPNGSRPFEWYFTAVRPPLLRDFFDGRLTTTLASQPDTHLLEVELTIEHSVIRTG